MRFTLSIILSIFSVSVFAQGSIPAPELLYYKFDGSGTTVPNLATTPPAGTDTAYILGAITQGTAASPLCNGALIGSGNSASTDYLNTNYVTNLSNMSWSISMWTANISSSATLFYIFGDATAGSFRCFTNGIAGADNWVLRGTGMTDVYVNGGATVQAHMTTFVYDFTANTIYAYLDGVLVSTVAQTGPSISGTGPFKVMGYSTNVGSPAGGQMDEFRLYSHALTAQEVSDLYSRRTYSNTSVLSCGDYTSPSGNYVWTTDGTYNDTIPNMYCGDSVLTIDLSIVSPTTASFSATACDSYISPSGNYIWTSSGTYTDTIPNSIGCDSVMTFDLTVLHSSAGSLSLNGCESVLSPSGNHTWMSSGIYMDTVPNASGCDSVLTVDVTINQPSFSSTTVAACQTYTAPDGTEYTQSGTYTAVVPNAAGCDSTITIDLTVDDVDTTVTFQNAVLSANQSGAAYQWIDCQTMQSIPNATSQTYTPPGGGGSYSVEITSGACTLTSACHTVPTLSLKDNALSSVSIYPNPAEAIVMIDNPDGKSLQIDICDVSGKILTSQKTVETISTVQINSLASGSYLIRISGEGIVRTEHFVKR